MPATEIAVILAHAGIQFVGLTALKINQMNNLDSGLRRNDGRLRGRYGNTLLVPTLQRCPGFRDAGASRTGFPRWSVGTSGGGEQVPATEIAVIPAHAGIQFVGLTALKINQMNNLDSGLRRNDGRLRGRYGNTHSL